MKNSLIRVLISLFLCCCLVLNVAAIPAKAVGVDWILRQIATDIGVSAILEGLGIFRDAASDYFGELVDEVSDALDTAGQVSSGLMNAYYKVDPLGTGSPLFAVPLSLISFVRNWVFDNGVVSDSYSGFSASQISAIEGAVEHFEDGWSFSNPYCILREVGNGNLSLACSKYPFTLDSDGIYRSYSDSKAQTFSIYTIYPDYFSARQGVYTVFNPSGTPVRLFRGSSPISTYNPIVLGTIAPPDTLFTSAYPQWLEHQRELEDGTTETVVQIGLGNTQAETESLTQEQIWSGQGTLTVPEVVPGTATLTDVISAIVALPGQMVVSITDALSTFFTPSGTIEAYSLDLKELFPFCIPFDIYDFLAALSADPVPPVFEFDLNLGVATEPMKIDLSNWSDLAAIIRTLELGLFCVGLALKTRELIGG